MKSTIFGVLALIVLPMQSVFAGALYGTLKVENISRAGFIVFLECPENQRASATTDAHGGYSLRVQAVGSCNMWVQSGGSIGKRFGVFVSDKPMHLDISVDNSLNKK